MHKMVEFYNLEICNLTRQLPLKKISKNTHLANFNILGDLELVEAISQELSKKLKKYNFDYLVGPAVKVVPLIHQLAEKLKHSHYIICRKSVKPYMVSPVILKPLPHFPKHVDQLVLDGPDSELLKNKKVVIVDDVVSTGVTMRMIDKLMEKVNAKVVAHAAAIRQGQNQFDEISNFIYLAELPIFKTSS
jgi:adenine phosphoribosyltransferase